jgi:hypothetical protein
LGDSPESELRCRGINHKKEYDIQNTANVVNLLTNKHLYSVYDTYHYFILQTQKVLHSPLNTTDNYIFQCFKMSYSTSEERSIEHQSLLFSSSITSPTTVTLGVGLTAFNISLQYSEVGKASEKQEISKYFDRETSPSPLTQYCTELGTRASNTTF